MTAFILYFPAAYEKLARESREKFEPPALDVQKLSMSLSCSFQEYGEYDSYYLLRTGVEESFTSTCLANLDFYLTAPSPLVLL